MPDDTPPPQDTPPPASWVSGALDPSTPGALIADWHTKSPEPNKWEPYKGAKTLDELVDMAGKRVSDAQAALRARHQPPARPAADAAPEAWKAYRESLGLPETPDGYKLTKPEGFPDALWNDDDAKGWAAWAHENDVPPALMEKMAGRYHEAIQNQYADRQKAEAEMLQKIQADEAAALTKEFGPKLDATLQSVRSVVEAAGLPAALADPKAPQFGGFAFVKMVSGLLAQIPRGEDGTRRSVGPGETKVYDKTWAREAIRPGHPDYEALTNSKHPRHAELTQLRNLAYAA